MYKDHKRGRSLLGAGFLPGGAAAAKPAQRDASPGTSTQAATGGAQRGGYCATAPSRQGDEIFLDLAALSADHAQVLRQYSASGTSKEEALRNLTELLETEMAKLLALVESLKTKQKT
ncbi:hypothetical protein [Burkholderia sp. L27(2015)]|uniref:hypothetical protein n=1 Tax=Burkholderia sp. L27(2015) TaxID=1641858 RepID=UPI00131EB5F1|nr:hypothetical protein [Burkholderia sp. L27(2015)]